MRKMAKMKRPATQGLRISLNKRGATIIADNPVAIVAAVVVVVALIVLL